MLALSVLDSCFHLSGSSSSMHVSQDSSRKSCCYTSELSAERCFVVVSSEPLPMTVKSQSCVLSLDFPSSRSFFSNLSLVITFLCGVIVRPLTQEQSLKVTTARVRTNVEEFLVRQLSDHYRQPVKRRSSLRQRKACGLLVSFHRSTWQWGLFRPQVSANNVDMSPGDLDHVMVT